MFGLIDCKNYKICVILSIELRNITHRLPSLFQSNLLMIRAIIRKQRSRLFLVTHKRWNVEWTKSAGNREDIERNGKTCRRNYATLSAGANRRISLHIQIIPLAYWYADGETCRVKLPPGTYCPPEFRLGPFQLRTLVPARIQSYRREPGSSF